VFKAVILQAQMYQRISGVSAYFDYVKVAHTIDSQKSEDRDITDKLPQMLLATTKVPRMQSETLYFHMGKICCGLHASYYYYFQILDLKL
jgi:hypothetical protein